MNTLIGQQHGEILARMAVLADELHARVLAVLEKRELTVSELCKVFQLPQSTMSRHLKALTDAGWVVSRPEGTRRLYHLPTGDLDRAALRLWRLAREEIASSTSAVEDARRAETVVAERRARSREFFATESGRWDRMREELFGSGFFLPALAGLLDGDWVVGDLGCGNGPLAEAVAPFVRRVVAVDGSEAMRKAAQRRLAARENVDLRLGDLEDLPIEDGLRDAATLLLVLHHLPDPSTVFREVARVMAPGGRLLIVDMLPHDRQEYRAELGHVWMGFSEAQIARHLAGGGFRLQRFTALPPEPQAKGPTLFAAVAGRIESAHPEEPNERVGRRIE
jgi:ArsR family transcriptional regulator